MNRRSSHIQKSKEERQQYIKLLDQTHPDPTVDEQQTEFDPSNAVGKEEYEIPTDSVRDPPIIDQIEEYIKNHWLEWGFAILIIILGYFTIDSRLKDVDHGNSIEFNQIQIDTIKEDYQIDLEDMKSNLNNKIDDQQAQISLLDQFVDDINNSITDLKLLTNELLIKLDFVEKSIDN
jgi:hypothetical protein